MRSRISLFTLVFALSSFALPFAAHAAIPFFGPIIPAAYNVCPAAWALLIVVINNIISFLITLAIVFVAPLMFAYAGFTLIFNQGNPGAIGKAKDIFFSTVVGIVIAMSGWMIVDAFMAVLYNPSAAGGTWSSLIYGNAGATCLNQKGALPGNGLNQGVTTAPIVTTTGTGAVSTPPAGKAGTACDPATVMAAAATGGYTLTASQANILACIAQPESACTPNPNPPNYNWNSAKSSPGSSAAGAFQILLATNHKCYENSACYAAAGVTGPLNCQNGFTSNGNPIPGSTIVQQCLQAANNLNCSASAAACLVQTAGGSFSPWQADVNSQTQSGCITTGG